MLLSEVRANLADYDSRRGLRRRLWPRPEVELLREFLRQKTDLDSSVDIPFESFHDFCCARNVSLDAILWSNANAAQLIFKPWRDHIVIRPLNLAALLPQLQISALVLVPLVVPQVDLAAILHRHEQENRERFNHMIQQLHTERGSDYLLEVFRMRNIPYSFFQPSDYESLFNPQQPEPEPQPTWPQPDTTANAAPCA